MADPPGTHRHRTTRREVIEVRVSELARLFNAIDPSPFRERDLDPAAEAFIVAWARQVPRDAHLALLVYLDRNEDVAGASILLRDAVREFFSHRAEAARQRLHQLFQRGRTSLVIGVTCLTISVLAGDLLGRALGQGHLHELVQESLLVGGWVAMWRPMEIFLYDWWPIRAEARLADRLSAMPVRLAPAAGPRDSSEFQPRTAAHPRTEIASGGERTVRESA